MPFHEVSIVSQRREFVSLALQEGANVSLLCARFGISRTTGYKWLERARAGGQQAWAQDLSRRPRSSPWRCEGAVERAVIQVRQEHPAWGARKIRRYLEDRGRQGLPAPSTMTAILRRHGLIDPRESRKRGPMQRFERPAPNDLWQMDFKGPVRTGRGRCHPLTVEDDHSRYALGVEACVDETARSVQAALERIFSRYGLPQQMLMDNGACWGKVESAWTVLEVWLLRLGIAVSHGRPFHPQTQGKCERFNRTLQAEALAGRNFRDLGHCQVVFDEFRHSYNHERPHEALDLAVPATRYQPSLFGFLQALGPIEYLPGDVVRRVGVSGYISLGKRHYQVGRAFSGQPVALRPTNECGLWQVYFCHQRVAIVDERTGQCVQQD